SIALSFFFQAEDGIRDFHVTGSDVCSSDLPVLTRDRDPFPYGARRGFRPATNASAMRIMPRSFGWTVSTVPSPSSPSAYRIGRRSEERRVGKEGVSRRQEPA